MENCAFYDGKQLVTDKKMQTFSIFAHFWAGGGGNRKIPNNITPFYLQNMF